MRARIAIALFSFIPEILCAHHSRSDYDTSEFVEMEGERVNRTRYLARDEAQSDVFDYVERFYNRKRRHGYLGNISPAAYEERAQNQLQTVH